MFSRRGKRISSLKAKTANRDPTPEAWAGVVGTDDSVLPNSPAFVSDDLHNLATDEFSVGNIESIVFDIDADTSSNTPAVPPSLPPSDANTTTTEPVKTGTIVIKRKRDRTPKKSIQVAAQATTTINHDNEVIGEMFSSLDVQPVILSAVDRAKDKKRKRHEREVEASIRVLQFQTLFTAEEIKAAKIKIVEIYETDED